MTDQRRARMGQASMAMRSVDVDEETGKEKADNENVSAIPTRRRTVIEGPGPLNRARMLGGMR